MKTAALCNLIGAAFIVTAALINIVCLASSYYSVADFSKMKDAAKRADVSDMEKEALLEMATHNVTINYGILRICVVSDFQPDGKCLAWYVDEPKLDPGSWLMVARIFICLGSAVMVKSAIGAGLNVVVVSRGDRQKYLPFIICAFCCGGGLFTFIGVMIIAGNYKNLTDLPSGGITFSQTAKDLIGDTFSLSWCFGLDLLSAFLSCVAGVFHLVARRYNTPEYGHDGSHLI